MDKADCRISTSPGITPERDGHASAHQTELTFPLVMQLGGMRLDRLLLNQRSAYWEHLRTWQSAQAEFAASAFYACAAGKAAEA